MERYRVTGFPVVDDTGRVVGIVTNRDMRFASDDATPVSVMMTTDNLAILHEPADRDEAISLMKARRIEKLLVTDGKGKLTGSVDAERHRTGRAEPDRLQGRVWAACGWLRPHRGRCGV